MNFSRQALLGIGMIIGGSVMLYAMLQQIGTSDNNKITPALVETSVNETASNPPLTTDIETEKRLLAQKQKERALRVAEQEKRAEQFLAEQESAEAKALAKSRAENQQYVDNNMPEVVEEDTAQTTLATPIVQSRTDSTIATTSKRAVESSTKSIEEPQKRAADEAKKAAERQQQAAKQKAETVAREQAASKRKAAQQAAEQRTAEQKAQAARSEPPSSPSEYTVKPGDGLIKLARQYNVPVEALAQANNVSPSSALQLGQTLTIPSRKQIERLEREAAAAEKVREEKRKQEQALAKKSADAKRDAQQKLQAARQTVKETGAKGSFGVQVALADNQSKADDLAKKFQAAGYTVKTSATSRGVRVIVGPERGKVAALALKDKVNSDPKVNTTNAWVLYWR